MLLSLSIRNIALIDRLEVSFTSGLNVLTGETGAGKSIVVGSLDFVLGGRADKDRIAQGADRGVVEALFDIGAQPKIQKLLDELGLSAEDGLLPVSREIQRSGRSICRVAGMVVPLSQLREITSQLVELHGQHAHQSLLDAKNHLGFLDAMGGEAHRLEAAGVRKLYDSWYSVKSALACAEKTAMERARREDMLRFQVDELDAARLLPDEEEDLERRRSAMRSAEKIRSALEKASGLIEGSDDFSEGLPAMDALRQAANGVSALSKYGEHFEKTGDQLWEVVYALEGACADLNALLDECSDDPRALEQVEARLDLLSRLRKKYGSTTRDMLSYLEKAREELEESENMGERLDLLHQEESVRRVALEQQAARLSEARRTLARQCEDRVMAELNDLGMEKAVFRVEFGADPILSCDGIDQIEFLLSANSGQPLRPLAKVASGGELSRIMLAMKCIEAENEGVPVLVFDEVDTGIGGRMGQIVAEKMASVSRSHQVLCVTHLPQIAAAAHTQFLVEKSDQEGRTHTFVKSLDETGRVEVLSAMLGGGDTAREHARVMLAHSKEQNI